MTTMTEQRFTDILNKDAAATAMLEKLVAHALESGMTPDQFLEARKTLVMLTIAKNPKLLDDLAEEVYNSFNAS